MAGYSWRIEPCFIGNRSVSSRRCCRCYYEATDDASVASREAVGLGEGFQWPLDGRCFLVDCLLLASALGLSFYVLIDKYIHICNTSYIYNK